VFSSHFLGLLHNTESLLSMPKRANNVRQAVYVTLANGAATAATGHHLGNEIPLKSLFSQYHLGYILSECCLRLLILRERHQPRGKT
jgi:hydrogenase/urease accessory protein HupE